MSERLAGLCRLWGAVKFFHPFVVCKDIDWDRGARRGDPVVREAGSAVEYRKALEHLLSFLDDLMTAVSSGGASPIVRTFPDTVSRWSLGCAGSMVTWVSSSPVTSPLWSWGLS
jgi:hypothetical protein